MILDQIENWKTYAGLGAGLAQGLEMLASGKLDVLPAGKHVLDGDKLYASVQEYAPKAVYEGRWEAHRQYADIQYLVRGSEAMGYCPVDQLSAAEPYDEAKDIAFFKGGIDAGTLLNVEASMFAAFFPADAHMPSLAGARVPHAGLGGPAVGRVKKIVLKVKID